MELKMHRGVHCVTECKPQYGVSDFKLQPQSDVIEEFDMLSNYRPIISKKYYIYELLLKN